MSVIKFESKIEEINSWLLVRLPLSESQKLPSRGQVMVEGTIDKHHFQSPLEPDGNFSHWLHLDKQLQKAIGKNVGDTVSLIFQATATKDWPEPMIPADIQTGIVEHADTHALWGRVTPVARWEWLRWIDSTANVDTRKKRIEVSRSKLLNGLRRPCCFNRSMCCVPQVSKSGVLIGAK